MRRPGLKALLLTSLCGCATPQTKSIQLDPREVAAEEALQRELALTDQLEQQQRLTNLAYGILRQGTSLCPEAQVRAWGARFMTAAQYEGPWYVAARSIGLSDTVQVVSVARSSPADVAGLRIGDRLLAVKGQPIPQGVVNPESIGWEAVTGSSGVRAADTLEIVTDGVVRTLVVEAETACGYRATVVPQSELNAYADGRDVFVTSAMMRFAEDEELRVVLSHEFAHNAMEHISAMKRNATIGAIIGAIADGAIAASGGNSRGAYTALGAALGARKYSQEFEREADYVGMYFLARSDFPMERAPRFWRHMAQADPDAIGFASTHPTSAERFVLMRMAQDEIQSKQTAGLALLPEMREDARYVVDSSGDRLALSESEPGRAETEQAADAVVVSARDAPPSSPTAAGMKIPAIPVAESKLDPDSRADEELIDGIWRPAGSPGRWNDHPIPVLPEEASPQDVEHWVGAVEGVLPADLPKVTVRLYDRPTDEAEIGVVIYWFPQGPCSYVLERYELGDPWWRSRQVAESPECGGMGDLWLRSTETEIETIWFRPDGSLWFTSRLNED